MGGVPDTGKGPEPKNCSTDPKNGVGGMAKPLNSALKSLEGIKYPLPLQSMIIAGDDARVASQGLNPAHNTN